MGDFLLLLAIVADLKIYMNGKYYLQFFDFITLPLLSLTCALKVTKTYYETLIDTGMLLVMKLMLEEKYQELFAIMQKQIMNTCMINTVTLYQKNPLRRRRIC